MKEQILQWLKQQDGYVSGQALCEHFGVSRTAVWKQIQALKKDGYVIDSVSNKGYKLISSPDALFGEEVLPRLHTAWAGRHYYYYAQTDSTNIRAKQLAEEGAPHGSLVVAEKQTAGRGRRGRTWVIPEGESITMSLLLKPEMELINASMLTLVAAMAIADAVRRALGDAATCYIKWPNDIVVNGKKICGILTEMTTEADYINSIVIGIGLNVNTTTFDPAVRDVATSLRLETGRCYSRSQLIADVMEAFEHYYDIFMQTQDLSALTDAYNAMLINCGRQVRVIEQDGEHIVTARSVTRTGGLLVENADGTEREIISGEVSVRGVLGYV